MADFRDGAAFLTLDYTDGPTPVVYSGQSVQLPELRCQLLRDDEQIKASSKQIPRPPGHAGLSFLRQRDQLRSRQDQLPGVPRLRHHTRRLRPPGDRTGHAA
ncbi:hypothetical protein LP420_09410 [Massilia sp. B-10]|nr:hypothetical protein LP420_09410 [Massilia sp. B-10]